LGVTSCPFFSGFSQFNRVFANRPFHARNSNHNNSDIWLRQIRVEPSYELPVTGNFCFANTLKTELSASGGMIFPMAFSDCACAGKVANRCPRFVIFRPPYPCSRLGTLSPSRKFESRHSPHSFSRGYSYVFKGSHLKFRTCIIFSYKPPRMLSLLRGSLWASSLTKALFFPENSPLFHNSNDYQLTRFCRPSICFPRW